MNMGNYNKSTIEGGFSVKGKTIREIKVGDRN